MIGQGYAHRLAVLRAVQALGVSLLLGVIPAAAVAQNPAQAAPPPGGDVFVGGDTPDGAPDGQDASAATNGAKTASQKSAAGSGDKTHCIEASIGNVQSFGCVNQHLSDLARAQPRLSSQDAPYSATSPGYSVGVFNEAAARQRPGFRMGNYTTPLPYRPPVTNPLIPHG